MPKLGGTKVAVNKYSGVTFTISGTARSVRLPNVDGRPFDMEFDIALFQGKLGALGGFKMPLCKFIIAKGTNTNLEELMNRLHEGLTIAKEVDISSALFSLVDDDWPMWNTEIKDVYHGGKTLPVTYIWSS